MPSETLGLCGGNAGSSGISRCGTELLLVPYKDKANAQQEAVICPRCDSIKLWPKRKKRK